MITLQSKLEKLFYD